ncbi:hypothetical protein ACT16_15650 [Mycobacterium heckeshornense]|nr:hypothetical protein ACT16_15650 [Mycobacterium heckeshornense]
MFRRGSPAPVTDVFANSAPNARMVVRQPTAYACELSLTGAGRRYTWQCRHLVRRVGEIAVEPLTHPGCTTTVLRARGRQAEARRYWQGGPR